MSDAKRLGYTYADLHVGMAFRSPGRTITDDIASSTVAAVAASSTVLTGFPSAQVSRRGSRVSSRPASLPWTTYDS